MKFNFLLAIISFTIFNNMPINNNSVITTPLLHYWTTNDKALYYNKDKTSFTITSSYNAILHDKFSSIFTWELGRTYNPTKFEKISIINPDDCYTKISWGKTTSYMGKPLYKVVENKNFNDVVTNRRVDDWKKIADYANLKLLDMKRYYNLICYIVIKEYAGFSWYFNNSDYKFYFQAYFYFDLEVIGSLVGGRQWVNVGAGIHIS